MENKIVEKIKKLLSLATSSNENEAKAASAKATELMTKYNLDMQSVNYVDAEYIKDDIYSGSRRKSEHKFLGSILMQYFNVEVITSRKGGTSTIRIVGDKNNTEIARHTFNFLNSAFKNLFEQYKRETGASNKSRQSYYFGLYQGFCEQMEAAKTKVEQERGLVLVPDAGLAKYIKQEYPRISRTNQRVNTGDSSAKEAGVEAGRNLSVSKGISSQNSGNIRQLG